MIYSSVCTGCPSNADKLSPPSPLDVAFIWIQPHGSHQKMDQKWTRKCFWCYVSLIFAFLTSWTFDLFITEELDPGSRKCYTLPPCGGTSGRMDSFDVYPTVVISFMSVPKYILNASSNCINNLCELKSESSMTLNFAVGRMWFLVGQDV